MIERTFSGQTGVSRRQFTRNIALGSFAVGATGLLLPEYFWKPENFADELTKTPNMAEGPFYPDKLPLDTDNDLLVINESITPAVGEITHLAGKVVDVNGDPLRNAFVEIWQVDNRGVYLHSGSNDRDNYDTNFQGYGRFLTNVNGEYYFRTIKPVTYPGRTPHIHFAVSHRGKRVLTTQMLIKDEPRNERDGLFRAIRDEKLRNLLVADFSPLKGSKIGELTAQFDMVVGATPNEDDDQKVKGIAKPRRR